MLKKNEKGLRGKQQFEQFTQYQDIFSHFSTFYVKTFAFFKKKTYYCNRDLEKIESFSTFLKYQTIYIKQD